MCWLKRHTRRHDEDDLLLLTVVGAVVPCIFFGNFMLQEGVNLTGFVRQLFANSPASGFTVDLLITSLHSGFGRSAKLGNGE